MRDRDILALAKPCPFCQLAFVAETDFYFQNGALTCDRCEADGPFARHLTGEDDTEGKLEAVRLWNIRTAAEWERPER